MVNTGQVKLSPVQFTAILGEADWNGTYNIKNIPITVNIRGEIIQLSTETGKASEKILVTTDYEWCKEFQSIHQKYPKFKDWITDKTIKWYTHE